MGDAAENTMVGAATDGGAGAALTRRRWGSVCPTVDAGRRRETWSAAETDDEDRAVTPTRETAGMNAIGGECGGGREEG